MAIGAYENPTSYGVDSTESLDILQKGMEATMASVQSIEKQRVDARNKLEEDFAEFKELNYISDLEGVNNGINEAIRNSVGNALSLGDFSNLSPEEKSRLTLSAKEAKVGRDAISQLITAAESNVTDPRIPAEQSEFVTDIMNGRNIEYAPSKDGIGFELIHTDSKGEKRPYNAGKIAMMVSQFQDIDPILEGVDKAKGLALAALQKKKAFAMKQGSDIKPEDIEAASRALYDRMPLRDKEIYFAEYVMRGAELNPKYKKVDGKKVPLNDQEKAFLSKQRNDIFKQYMREELNSQLIDVPYEEPKHTNVDVENARGYWDVKLQEEKNKAKVNQDNGGKTDEIPEDKDLYATLQQYQIKGKGKEKQESVDFEYITSALVSKEEEEVIPELISKYGDYFDFEESALGDAVAISPKGKTTGKVFQLDNWTEGGNKTAAAEMKQWMKNKITKKETSKGRRIEGLDLTGNRYATSEGSEVITDALVKDGFLVIYGEPKWNAKEGEKLPYELGTFNLSSPSSINNAYKNIMRGNLGEKVNYKIPSSSSNQGKKKSEEQEVDAFGNPI